MRKNYQRMFENTPNLFCEIKNRIVLGNKVIDEEYVRFNDGYLEAVAIYEVENGKIVKVTFVRGWLGLEKNLHPHQDAHWDIFNSGLGIFTAL